MYANVLTLERLRKQLNAKLRHKQDDSEFALEIMNWNKNGRE